MEAAAVQQPDVDTLANLEERITRAVQAITALRSENQQLQDRLARTESDLEATRAELATVNEELQGMRGERKQVKARIEKLLGQLDLLSA